MDIAVGLQKQETNSNASDREWSEAAFVKNKKLSYEELIAPIIYILAGVTILALAFFERPVESSIAILTVIVGIPVYLFFKKRYEMKDFSE